MAMSLSLFRWLGILLLALASLGCGLVDKLTGSNSDGLSIQRFSASPVTIAPGSPTTLTWEVDGATTIVIDNGIGQVPAKGSREVLPGSTTTFNLTAEAGSSRATASVQVLVQGTLPSPSPSPSPSPTPSPSPSPTPSPSPSPTPSPSPSPSPTPSPSPSPTPAPECGAPAGAAGNCAVAITKPNAVPGGGCVEVNLVTVSQSCPVGMTLPLVLRFDVTAHTSLSTLNWRQAASNGDVMEPGQGILNGNGSTTVVLTDVVLDSAANIEILGGGSVLLTLSVRH